MIRDPNEYYNNLPIEQRAKLSPMIRDTVIRTLKAARAIQSRHHKAALQELDAWITNCERELWE